MSFSAFDHQCMAQAIRLAGKGLYSTDPNPRVGCVLALDEQVIARGWHEKAGEAHAEIHALNGCGPLARGSTAYVTLEPCSHQGKTASCARALIDAGISRVVCATRDPNPLVNGAGFRMLEAAGVRVETGLLRGEAEALNPGFEKRMRHGRPWVRVKLALSLDGRTGLAGGDSRWISSTASRNDVQSWRARSSAVMTGIETILADDPSLNVRIEGSSRQPARIIIDSRWRTPAGAQTLGLPGNVIVAGSKAREVPEALRQTGAQLLPVRENAGGRLDLEALMTQLGDMEINEIQVESGATLAGSLLECGLVDELLLYQAPVILGSGARDAFRTGVLENMRDRYELECLESIRTGPDLRSVFRLKREEA